MTSEVRSSDLKKRKNSSFLKRGSEKIGLPKKGSLAKKYSSYSNTRTLSSSEAQRRWEQEREEGEK